MSKFNKTSHSEDKSLRWSGSMRPVDTESLKKIVNGKVTTIIVDDKVINKFIATTSLNRYAATSTNNSRWQRYGQGAYAGGQLVAKSSTNGTWINPNFHFKKSKRA